MPKAKYVTLGHVPVRQQSVLEFIYYDEKLGKSAFRSVSHNTAPNSEDSQAENVIEVFHFGFSGGARCLDLMKLEGCQSMQD